MQGKEDYEPDQQHDISDDDTSRSQMTRASGMTVVNPKTGELETLPTTLSDIARRDTGGMGTQIETSIDKTTKEGLIHLSRMLDADKPKNHIENDGWLGRPFKMISYTSKGVLAKKDTNGVVYDVPRPLIRTVVETDEGDFFITSSSYVYESIKQIAAIRGVPSEQNPILVKLMKGGQALKLIQVYDEPAKKIKK
jgi:hypothetical protein